MKRMEDIIARAARLFGTTRAEITGRSRPTYVVKARFAVAWAAARGSPRSSVEIGKGLGDRDHTTILSAVARAEEFRVDDLDFRLKTDALLDFVTSGEPTAKALGEHQFSLALE